MAISKLIFNGVIQMDVTGTTADENSVLSGYGAVGSDGQWFDGIASGGGGGLVYEAGTFSPSADIARPTINFTNAHTDPPWAIAMAVDDGGTVTANGSMVWWDYVCHSYAVGLSPATSATSVQRGRVQYEYINDSGNATGGGYNLLTIQGTGTNAIEYWVTNSAFVPGGASRYFRAGTDYKWLAVWAPT